MMEMEMETTVTESPRDEAAFTQIYEKLGPAGVARARMFGRSTLTIDGKIFACLSEGIFGAKLRSDRDAYDTAMQMPGAHPFSPATKGRAFGGWVGFPVEQESAWLPMARTALAAMLRELAKPT